MINLQLLTLKQNELGLFKVYKNGFFFAHIFHIAKNWSSGDETNLKYYYLDFDICTRLNCRFYFLTPKCCSWSTCFDPATTILGATSTIQRETIKKNADTTPFRTQTLLKGVVLQLYAFFSAGVFRCHLHILLIKLDSYYIYIDIYTQKNRWVL